MVRADERADHARSLLFEWIIHASGDSASGVHALRKGFRCGQGTADCAAMNEKILGVLGGMGPLASAHFMLRLTLLPPARRDQDHIPAVLWSDPRVPDRT